MINSNSYSTSTDISNLIEHAVLKINAIDTSSKDFLKKLKTKETFDLNDFYGHSFEHKWLAFGFLLSSLALIGFPITTTFLGEDLLFTHIKEDQFFIATCVSVCYIVEGIAAIRIYSRIFLGPHKKSYHPVPLRDA